MGSERIVIVGAGQAGAQVAFSLRQWGHEGAIALIGDEASAPYERPPLSKDFLKGAVGADALLLRTADWYASSGVELRTGVRAAAVDRDRAVVALDGGDELPWDTLVLATGSRPRPLPVEGASLAGVHELRTMDDARRLGADLVPGARVLVVGAGYVGLEVAAVARTLGHEVTVLGLEEVRERPQRHRAGEARRRRHARTCAPDRGSALVLVRPVRPQAADRRPRRRRRPHRAARRPGLAPLRGLPPPRGGARPDPAALADPSVSMKDILDAHRS